MNKNLSKIVFGIAVVFIIVLVVQGSKSSSFFEKNLDKRKSADLTGVLSCLDSCRGMADGLAGMNLEQSSRNYLRQVQKLEDKYNQCSYMNSLLSSSEQLPENEIKLACGQPIEEANLYVVIPENPRLTSFYSHLLPVISNDSPPSINCNFVFDNISCEDDLQCIVDLLTTNNCADVYPLNTNITLTPDDPDNIQITWSICDSDSLSFAPENCTTSSDEILPLVLSKLHTFVVPTSIGCVSDSGCDDNNPCTVSDTCSNGSCGYVNAQDGTLCIVNNGKLRGACKGGICDTRGQSCTANSDCLPEQVCNNGRCAII